MKITVRLFASLRTGRFDSAVLELPDRSNVAAALAASDVPESEAAIMFINSRHALPESALCDGDALAVFPLVGGG